MTARVKNGNEDLKAAMALLLHNQAVFVSHIDDDRQRFAKIEKGHSSLKKAHEEMRALLLQHNEILKRHEQMLQEFKELRKMIENLPEAIRQKIGFKQ